MSKLKEHILNNFNTYLKTMNYPNTSLLKDYNQYDFSKIKERLDNLREKYYGLHEDDSIRARIDRLPKPGDISSRMNEMIDEVNRLGNEIHKIEEIALATMGAVNGLLEVRGIKSLIELNKDDA